jgi:hypothetical protein
MDCLEESSSLSPMKKKGRKEGRKCEGCMDTLEEGNISSGIVPARDPRSLQKKKN